MNRILLLAGAAVLVMSISCTRDENPVENQETLFEKSDRQAFEQGVIEVKFNEVMAEAIEADLENNGIVTKSTSSDIAGMYDELGILSMSRVFPYAGEYEKRTRAEGLHRWYRISYTSKTSVTKAADSFELLPGVETVSPVRRIKSTASSMYFNDPKSSNQWHYYNDGTLSSKHSKGADINVVPVWENYTKGSSIVTVGIVDGGIDYNHEDLADAYAGGRNFVTYGQVAAHDHGTHVAGTVGAVNNNGKGVSGVAGGDAAKGIKGVKLLSAQIFMTDPENPSKDKGGSGAEAIKWAADNGAVIAQNSWGYYDENPDNLADVHIDGALKAAVDYFIKYAGCDNDGNQKSDSPMKGGVVIFAAGNDARPFGPPSDYEPIIAVGSIGPDYSRAYYSNYGDFIDIAAPGGDANYANGQVYSTLPDSKYGWMQGTSMAGPHVSGVAALLVSYFGKQGFTNEMLKEKLLKGANSKALNPNSKIGPLVDALGAITYGSTTAPEKVSSYTVRASGNTLFFDWKVTKDADDVKAYGFLLVASKDRNTLTGSMQPLPEGVACSSIESGTAKVGDDISGELAELDFESSYYVGSIAYVYSGNYSATSEIKEISTLKNNPPVISIEKEGELTVKAHQVMVIPVSISDPDGHAVTVKYQSGGRADVLAKNPLTELYELTITGNATEPGTYTGVITASDKWNSSTYEIKYTVLENQAPVVIKEIEDMVFEMPGEKFIIDMNEYVTDPDEEKLTFSIQISNRNVVHMNPSENILNGTTLDYGISDVTIKASDAKGESCSLSFRVGVPDPAIPVRIYPNPVREVMNVATGVKYSTRVTVFSSSGSKVFEAVDDVSYTEPMVINMKDNAPGRYIVKVEADGEEHTMTVVKL